MMKIRRSLATVILFACSWSVAPAETIRVPHHHKTIQAAIDSAATGDIVLVAAGTYHERLRLKPRVTLRSDGTDEKGKLGFK